VFEGIPIISVKYGEWEGEGRGKGRKVKRKGREEVMQFQILLLKSLDNAQIFDSSL